MLVKRIKTIALVISRSKTLSPIFFNLLLDGIVEERVRKLKVPKVVLDTNCHLKVILG